MRNKLFFTIFGLVVGLLVGRQFTLGSTPQNDSFEEYVSPKNGGIELAYPADEINISEEEKNIVAGVVRNFQDKQVTKEGGAVLDMFTQPLTSSEIETYNFLTGKDLPNPFVRLFSTAGLSYDLNWYYVTSIEKRDGRYMVGLIELRTARDNSVPDYFVHRESLVLELDNEYKIKAYRRTSPIQTEFGLTNKYEGFY